MIDLSGKHIAILKGGPGSERAVSLASGAGVAKALRSAGAEATEVDVRDASFDLPDATDLAFIVVHRRERGRKLARFRQDFVEGKIYPARREYSAMGNHPPG